MYNYSRAEESRVPGTETKLKFMIIPTLGKENGPHFPICNIIPKKLPPLVYVATTEQENTDGIEASVTDS